MKATIFLLALIPLLSLCNAEEIKLEVSWSINPTDNSYTNSQTGIVFPERVNDFTRFRAEPTKQDGSASFAYKNEEGVVTVYLKHKLIAGFPGPNPVFPAFFSIFQKGLDDLHGKPRGKEQYQLSRENGAQFSPGIMYSCSYPKSKELKPGKYTSLAVVQVDDFLYVFRGTFMAEKGLDSFRAFLEKQNIRIVQPGAAHNGGKPPRES